MPTTKNSTKQSNSSNRSENNGGDRQPPSFITYRLNEDELAQAKNAAETYSDLGEIIAQFIEEGYKFSASHDNYGGGSQCFITPSSKEAVNAGYTLSARAPTLIAAVAVLCWKHYTLFSQDWPKEGIQQRGGGWG